MLRVFLIFRFQAWRFLRCVFTVHLETAPARLRSLLCGKRGEEGFSPSSLSSLFSLPRPPSSLPSSAVVPLPSLSPSLFPGVARLLGQNMASGVIKGRRRGRRNRRRCSLGSEGGSGKSNEGTLTGRRKERWKVDYDRFKGKGKEERKDLISREFFGVGRDFGFSVLLLFPPHNCRVGRFLSWVD